MYNKKRWTKEEEKIVADVILECLLEGKGMFMAYQEASIVLNRSIEGVKSRWKDNIKQNYSQQLKLIEDSANQKNRARRKWSYLEKVELINLVDKYIHEGKKVEAALKEFSIKSDRTYKSVYCMWYGKLRQIYRGECYEKYGI